MFKFIKRYKNIYRNNILLQKELLEAREKLKEKEDKIENRPQEESFTYSFIVDMNEIDNVKTRIKEGVNGVSFQVLFYKKNTLIEACWLNGFKKQHIDDWLVKIRSRLRSHCVVGLNHDRTLFVEGK